MTRFWITLEQGVRFVIRCTEQMQGGEVFVPKIPSMNILDLVQAIAPESQIDYVGIRPGEKLHEYLVSENEARQTLELADMYIIEPAHPWWTQAPWQHATPVPDDFCYRSDINEERLSIEALQALIQEDQNTL